MKKQVITAIVVSALIAVSAIGLYGCQDNVPTKVNSKGVYALSAITSAAHLTSNNTQLSISEPTNLSVANYYLATANNAETTTLARPTVLNEDIEQINEYVNMFKKCLLNGGLEQSVTVPTQADGEYSIYATKLTVSFPTATGNVENILYYNETAVASELNINDKKNGDDEQDDETEVSTILNGVLLSNGEKFDIKGEKNVETEGDEVEIEIIFTTRSKANPKNYIVVKEEIENDEMKYEYTVHSGDKVSKTVVKFELDDNDEEFAITFKLKDGTSPTTHTRYSFDKKVENGETYFEGSFMNKNVKNRFKIYPTDTANRFVYANGFEEIL